MNGIQASLNRRTYIQVFDLDYEVELVRVADIGEVQDAGFRSAT